MSNAKRDQLITMFNDPRVPWVNMEGETKRLDVETYKERYHACPFSPRLRAGSKTTGTIRIQPLTLVQHLMHQVKWRDFFTCIIADEIPYIPEREQRHAVIGSETKEERIELEAFFQVLSPLVPIIESKFTRTCHQMETLGEWLVFDLPTNDQDAWPYVRSCLVRNSGESSNVTWIVLENFQVEADNIYSGLLESGRGFGSMRWFETLARECRRQYMYSPNVLQGLRGRTKNVPVLAQWMTRNFCLGIAWATPHRFSSRIFREPMKGVSFGTALKYDEEEGDNYVTAVMSARVKGFYNAVFDHIKSLRPLGTRIVQIPSHETDDHVGLYYSLDDHEDMFIKESLKDASGAIWVYAPITNKILTKTIQKKTKKKNDSVLDSFGYVVYPDGNHSFSLVTIASQLNISDNNLNCFVGYEEMARENMVAYWEKTACTEILADFTNIQNHFAG